MLTQQKFSPEKRFSPAKNSVHPKDLNKKNFFPKKIKSVHKNKPLSPTKYFHTKKTFSKHQKKV